MEWFFRTTPGPVGNTTFGEICTGSQQVAALAMSIFFPKVE
jgi:hypothetical protein